MGKLKKAGVNEKAAEAKQSKDAKKSSQKDADATASEDAAWAAAGDGKQSKGVAWRERFPRPPVPPYWINGYLRGALYQQNSTRVHGARQSSL